MKNFSKILFGFGAAFAMTACASEEVANPAATTDVTVSVATDAGIASRALATIEGYELKCVMQLLDDNGATVGTQATASATAGKASFVIKAADIDAGASKALFWAEYVPTAAGTKVYNSADLTKISYNVTEFNAADANLMAAADAFAGTITTLTNGASTTLTRPMIQFNFSVKNPEVAAAATTLKVAYSAPSGYNVLTGNCDAAASQDVVYNNNAFAPTAKKWFSSFIFAPTNMSKYDKAITMTLGGGFDKVMTIAAETLPLDANYIVNTEGEISAGGDETLDVNVSVDVNGSFENEPKPAVFEVGAYVDAAGNPVSDKESAVGIVYHVGAIEGDEISLYPAEFAGKTIKGYVVAMENTIKARQQFNAAIIPDGLTPNENLINGTQNSAYILNAMGASAFVTAWNNWVAAHPLEANGNVTEWYIPARLQMEVWFGMLMVTYNLKGELIDGTPDGSEAFRALFPENTIFDRSPIANCMYATCSVNASGNIQGASLTASDLTVKFSQVDVKTKTQSVLGRAMFTVFE